MAFLGLLSLALLIVAFARPRHGKGSSEIEASGIDIVLTLDVSGSMEALDFELEGKPVNRLEVVKNVVGKFVGQRPNDKLGMVAFAGRPYLVSPLTLDHEFLGKRLADVKMGQVEDGTAIGSAIASSVDHLKDSTAKSRIIILLTDGVNNAGAVNPLTAAEAAKALGIKIYTIGAGTRGEAPVPVQDAFGRTHLADDEGGDRRGNAARSRRPPPAGNRSARPIPTRWRKSTTRSTSSKKPPASSRNTSSMTNSILWFLVPGLCLLLLELVLSQTRFRRLP